MNRRIIPESELVLNPDGSLYHISLLPEHIAETVIVVGDQERVERVSRNFDHIDYKIANREFVTHTGTFNGKKITVLSTGIGTDNIDIVLNELDAAVNIDLSTRQEKQEKRKLNIVRIGTSGALQADIPVDSFVASRYGLGLDGLMHFYNYPHSEEEKMLTEAFIEQTNWGEKQNSPYFVKCSDELISLVGRDMKQGITATASGFYGPQGRELRLTTPMKNINEQLTAFNYKNLSITNFEMETSGLYGLGNLLGHNCCTVCAIIANRIVMKFSKDYKKTIDQLIITVLQRLTA